MLETARNAKVTYMTIWIEMLRYIEIDDKQRSQYYADGWSELILFSGNQVDAEQQSETAFIAYKRLQCLQRLYRIDGHKIQNAIA